jgi:hypothetical protein
MNQDSSVSKGISYKLDRWSLIFARDFAIFVHRHVRTAVEAIQPYVIWAL